MPYPTSTNYLTNSQLLFQNQLINGNFDIWQRGTTSTGIATGSLLADRWALSYDAGGGTFPTHINRRTALTSGNLLGSFYSYELNVNGAGTSLGAGSYYWLRNKIEYGTRYLCGAGKKITLSFWAKSDIANKRLGFHIRQYYGSGGSPSTAEVINGTNFTLTSAWTQYTYTFTTNTLVGKTFGTANDDYIDLQMMYQWGSTYQDRAGSASAETFVGSGSIFIAQVRLYPGEFTALTLPQFIPLSYGDELRSCQRYFWKFNAQGQGYAYMAIGRTTGTTQAYVFTTHPVSMRSSPTLTFSTANTFLLNGVAVTVIAEDIKNIDSSSMLVTVASGLTANDSALLLSVAGGTGNISFSAEL